MARTIKVAAAQTGPVLTEDMAPGVEVACRMVRDAAEQGAEIICFSELFLTPFFPNQLRQDYEHFFLKLPSPVTDPLFETARRAGYRGAFVWSVLADDDQSAYPDEFVTWGAQLRA